MDDPHLLSFFKFGGAFCNIVIFMTTFLWGGGGVGATFSIYNLMKTF